MSEFIQATSAKADTEGRALISAFVICFNEEDQIADCLESLRFCDEIVCVDSYSTDRTVEICKEWGARVVQRKWGGYREQKDFGLNQATHEWVLNIDADERVSDGLRDSILQVLRDDYLVAQGLADPALRPADGYEFNRVVYYLGRWWRLGGWYPEYRLRFFRKSKTKWGGVDPHEKPIVLGKNRRLEGELYHFTYDNLEEQLRKLNTFSTIAAEEDYKRGKRSNVAKIFLSPVHRMLKFYLLKKGYREGVAGVIVAFVEGYYTFMKYAKLWELELMDKQQQNKTAHENE
jgi:glycosyltransferase involved in cell wall biosynthesis